MAFTSREDADDVSRWIACAREGRFSDAWAISDRVRERTRTFADPSLPRHQQVVWDGTPIEGRHVLVRCYHGLGDTIQFARYLPELRARASQVTVWAHERILPLLRTMPVDAHWLPLHDGEPGVAADVDVEIMELAYVFRTTLDTLPTAVPYLHARPRPFVVTDRPRVGLVWKAGVWDARRSVPFSAVVPLLDDDRIDWFSLQHHPDAAEDHPRLRRLPIDGVMATAQAARSLDLLVTIDSMSAHLGGALALPTWTLLRRHADWRWMEGRTDSPWYPTMRLFRQRLDGDWRDVVQRVQVALGDLSARHP